MGIYLYTSAAQDSVKISGPLADVVPVRSADTGSMPADEFLNRLSQAECAWSARAPWRDLVASGMFEELTAVAATHGLAATMGDDSPASLVLQHRKFQLARSLGQAALAACQPVRWG